MTNLASPPPTSCRRCGDRFRRASDALAHICRPNDTGFSPGDPVYVGSTPGVVRRVDRGSAEVYFRSSFQSRWYPASMLEPVTV